MKKLGLILPLAFILSATLAATKVPPLKIASTKSEETPDKQKLGERLNSDCLPELATRPTLYFANDTDIVYRNLKEKYLAGTMFSDKCSTTFFDYDRSIKIDDSNNRKRSKE